jgi:hypothetical protein
MQCRTPSLSCDLMYTQRGEEGAGAQASASWPGGAWPRSAEGVVTMCRKISWVAMPAATTVVSAISGLCTCSLLPSPEW